MSATNWRRWDCGSAMPWLHSAVRSSRGEFAADDPLLEASDLKFTLPSRACCIAPPLRSCSADYCTYVQHRMFNIRVKLLQAAKTAKDGELAERGGR